MGCYECMRYGPRQNLDHGRTNRGPGLANTFAAWRLIKILLPTMSPASTKKAERASGDFRCPERMAAVASGERPSLGRPQCSSRGSGSSFVRQSCVLQAGTPAQRTTLCRIPSEYFHQMAAMTTAGKQLQRRCYGSERAYSMLCRSQGLPGFRPGTASLVCCDTCVEQHKIFVTITAGHARSLVAPSQPLRQKALSHLQTKPFHTIIDPTRHHRQVRRQVQSAFTPWEGILKIF